MEQQEELTKQPSEPQGGGVLAKVDRYFGISKSGSNFRTEIVAGLTTFMAMAYILMVNPTGKSHDNQRRGLPTYEYRLSKGDFAKSA